MKLSHTESCCDCHQNQKESDIECAGKHAIIKDPGNALDANGRAATEISFGRNSGTDHAIGDIAWPELDDLPASINPGT
jgi:hypothetical protein